MCAIFVGLGNRLKGEERFKEKVSDELRGKPYRSIAEITERMPDAIRYTFQLDADRYAAGYWNIRDRLELGGSEQIMSPTPGIALTTREIPDGSPRKAKCSRCSFTHQRAIKQNSSLTPLTNGFGLSLLPGRSVLSSKPFRRTCQHAFPRLKARWQFPTSGGRDTDA